MSQMPTSQQAAGSNQPSGTQSGQSAQGWLFPTQNRLPEQTRIAVIEGLNRTLADTTDLRTQAKFAHWNVKGAGFYELHLLFDELAEVLETHADMIAERATALGGQAMGTVRLAATNSRIPEIHTGAITGAEYVEQVATHLAIHDTNLYEGIETATQYGDPDTADLYNEISREVSKYLWFLEAHLQTQPVSSRSMTGGPPGSMQGAPTSQQSPGAAGGAQQPSTGGPREIQFGQSGNPQSGPPAQGSQARRSGGPQGSPPGW